MASFAVGALSLSSIHILPECGRGPLDGTDHRRLLILIAFLVVLTSFDVWSSYEHSRGSAMAGPSFGLIALGLQIAPCSVLFCAKAGTEGAEDRLMSPMCWPQLIGRGAHGTDHDHFETFG